MKQKYKYKNLIPFALIIFMVLAWYQIISTSVSLTNEYNGYLKSAREFSKDGILIDAIENYDNAIKMKDSVEVRKEMAEMYKANGMYDEAVDAAEAIISAFPENANSYEYLIDLYLGQELYGSCFSVYDRASKLGAVSDSMSKKIEEIRYKYQVIAQNILEVSQYSSDVCAVNYGEYWGFVDVAGNDVMDAQYKQVGTFVGDRAFVENAQGEMHFVDSAGSKRAVLPDGIVPQEVVGCQNNVYAVKNAGKYDYYTYDKQKVFGDFLDATAFVNGYAAVLTDSGYGLIDTSRNKVGNLNYTKVAVDERKVATEQERAFFMTGDSWLMVGMDGAVIGSDKYEDAKPFYANGSYAAVKKDGKWGFVDTEGKMVISPQFEDARSFSYGHAAVKQNGKWGFINNSGKVVVEPIFEDAKDMNSSGNIFVKENGAWQLISFYQYNY